MSCFSLVDARIPEHVGVGLEGLGFGCSQFGLRLLFVFGCPLIVWIFVIELRSLGLARFFLLNQNLMGKKKNLHRVDPYLNSDISM